MTNYRFYVASSLDGFIADDHDSLDWLVTQPIDAHGFMNYNRFMADIGVLAMGHTTYQWIVDHNMTSGEPWPYEVPTYVFTHRDLTPVADTIQTVSGTPGEHRAELVSAAGDKDVWIVGGGGLATQFARAGMLGEVMVSIAPVFLGSGRPLFTDAFNLELEEFDRNRAFLCARYSVRGPRAEEQL